MKSLVERKAFWDKHIADWRESGLSRSAYSQKVGVRLNQLCYWINKQTPPAAEKPNANFVPVKAIPASSSDTGFKLVLPNGLILQWQGQVSPAYVQQLISGLTP